MIITILSVWTVLLTAVVGRLIDRLEVIEFTVMDQHYTIAKLKQKLAKHRYRSGSRYWRISQRLDVQSWRIGQVQDDVDVLRCQMKSREEGTTGIVAASLRDAVRPAVPHP